MITDYEIYQLLEENGYEPSEENMLILKEDMLRNEIAERIILDENFFTRIADRCRHHLGYKAAKRNAKKEVNRKLRKLKKTSKKNPWLKYDYKQLSKELKSKIIEKEKDQLDKWKNRIFDDEKSGDWKDDTLSPEERRKRAKEYELAKKGLKDRKLTTKIQDYKDVFKKYGLTVSQDGDIAELSSTRGGQNRNGTRNRHGNGQNNNGQNGTGTGNGQNGNINGTGNGQNGNINGTGNGNQP